MSNEERAKLNDALAYQFNVSSLSLRWLEGRIKDCRTEQIRANGLLSKELKCRKLLYARRLDWETANYQKLMKEYERISQL